MMSGEEFVNTIRRIYIVMIYGYNLIVTGYYYYLSKRLFLYEHLNIIYTTDKHELLLTFNL